MEVPNGFEPLTLGYCSKLQSHALATELKDLEVEVQNSYYQCICTVSYATWTESSDNRAANNNGRLQSGSSGLDLLNRTDPTRLGSLRVPSQDGEIRLGTALTRLQDTPGLRRPAPPESPAADMQLSRSGPHLHGARVIT